MSPIALSALFALLPFPLLASLGADRPDGPRTEEEPPQEAAGPARLPSPRIVTALWFEDDAEEAVRFYTALFPDGQVLSESRWGPGGLLPEGTLLSATFRIAGQELLALNGRPGEPFSEAMSLLVHCDGQAEVDRLWDALTADGGRPGQCGWLVDRFGVSWQVVPTALVRMLGDPDPARARRVGEAMMGMGKLELARLEAAYEGR